MEFDIIEQYKPALKAQEFHVFYQPKVSLRDYRLVGAEALCRWVHEGLIIPPDSFIPVLEKTTAICDLDFYMLEHVCKDMQKWLSEGKKCVKVSVNLSRRHNINQELVEKIAGIIDSHQVPHELIEIELVETTSDMGYSQLKEMVMGLKKLGISTSVDDFGIGYSSMNLIRNLPWDVMKIDKSFLPEDSSDRRQNIMIKHLISLGQDMGLDCIVEGVETLEQVKLLKENNCFLAQGHFFDKALTKEQFEKRLPLLNR